MKLIIVGLIIAIPSLIAAYVTGDVLFAIPAGCGGWFIGMGLGERGY